MHDNHFLSHAASIWVKRKSTLAVAGGGLLALLLWTIPNWRTFWQYVFQFPVLWQTPANRQSMVALVIKVISPLLIMGMITILLWIFSLVRMEMEESEEPRQKRRLESISLMGRFSQSFFTHIQQKTLSLRFGRRRCSSDQKGIKILNRCARECMMIDPFQE